MSRKLSYFLGDTYSRDIFPFMKGIMSPNFQLEEYRYNSPTQLCFVSPSVDQRELKELKDQDSILILDFCHFDFLNIENYISHLKPNAVISPIEIGDTPILKASLNLLKTKREITISKNLNDSAILYCSQPLEEDNRGVSQNDFLRELSQSTNHEIIVKRHPREKEFVNLSDISLFDGSIENALERFSCWIGFNSMALYSARSLNHEVYMIKKDYPNHIEKMKTFIKSRKSNFNISSSLNSEELFLEEFFKLIS